MSSESYYIRDQYATHFLTFTIVEWVDVFTRACYKLIIADSLNYCIENKGLIVYAWCLMSNHLHLVVRANDKIHLSEIIRDFKKFTANRIIEKVSEINESRKDWILYRFTYAGKYDHRITNYKVWQDTSHAIQLDNSPILEQKINYIHQNPVRAMIVQNPEDYLFSSAIDYAGGKGLVKIEMR